MSWQGQQCLPSVLTWGPVLGWEQGEPADSARGTNAVDVAGENKGFKRSRKRGAGVSSSRSFVSKLGSDSFHHLVRNKCLAQVSWQISTF